MMTTHGKLCLVQKIYSVIYNISENTVKPGEWVKVNDKYTNETYKGQFVSCGLGGITIVMENGKEKLFEWVQSMMLIFYIETGRKLIMKMLCVCVQSRVIR